MKKVKDYVTEQEDLNEDNISDYITSYCNSHNQKRKDETNDVC